MEVDDAAIEAPLRGFDISMCRQRIVAQSERIQIARHEGDERRNRRCERNGRADMLQCITAACDPDVVHTHTARHPETQCLAGLPSDKFAGEGHRHESDAQRDTAFIRPSDQHP